MFPLFRLIRNVYLHGKLCVLKDMCCKEDEVVMELHPAKKDYVNVYNECLHLWKPQHETIPTPPKLFV